MNHFLSSEKITLTSSPSSSNEKIPISSSSISSTIDSKPVLIPKSLNSLSSPSSPLHAPSSLGVVPSLSTTSKDKIVVSSASDSESSSIKSELVSEPNLTKPLPKRPLVAYEEEDSKGSSPEPEPPASDCIEKEVEEVPEEKAEEESESLSEAPSSAPAADEPKPSTSSASSAEAQLPQPKTKRVRISLKLDSFSVQRLERLATVNPKLLRKLGLKAYRIKNFNGSSKRFQLIRVPDPAPRLPESSQTQSRGRRPNRTTSASSSTSTFPFPIAASPTPRFRAPYPHQRNITTAFEYPKGGAPINNSGYPMDRTPQVQQQPQQFQYQYSQPPQYQQQPRPPMPPQQQQPQQPQQQQMRPPNMATQEPGTSNSCSDSPLLVGLLSNNNQQPQQPPQMPNQQQVRYPPQQGQQMPPQGYPSHQGYPPQQMQQPMHMIPPQGYQYQQQRMPGPPPHHMPPGGGMQPMPGQMMNPQGMPPQQQQMQAHVQQLAQPEPPAPKKRKRQPKKKKEDEKAQQVVASQQKMIGMQYHPQDYGMMQRMPQQMPPNMSQQRMPFYPGYSQGQPSTSMMHYPQHGGYPSPHQPQMWQPNPHEYQNQYQMQMMRPQSQQQNPGTPTSGYPPPHQSPGYAPNPAAAAAQQQQQKIRTPTGYPQPSPQYPGPNPQQQGMNRQFMSPQNHSSPSYQQPPQNQFGYPPQGQPNQQHQNRPMQGQAQQQQNTSGNLEDYSGLTDYNGASLEDLAATFGDLGEECDLDSITVTPMHTDPMMSQQQQQHNPMMQQNQQMHQQQQQPPPYEQHHQFVAPHMPPQHQQSPMGPPQGYHASPAYGQMPPPNQQEAHFQRPPSGGQQQQQQQMHMYMQHPQMQQQQQHHHHQQQQQQQQPPQQQHVPQPVNDEPPNGSSEEGYTTVYDEKCNSPPKANQEQQRNIMKSIDFVYNKIRNDDNKYLDPIMNRWINNLNHGDDAAPASATKRKSKSTSSRPPSRQPKNSQPSSAAATPTSGPGPFFGGNSTGTEPSTPIKEEPMDFKHERKNSTLSSLLSGNSTPTIKCEENGHPEASTSVATTIVKTESRDTETPVSVASGNTDMEQHTASTNSPNTLSGDAGVSKVEGNGQFYNGHPSNISPLASNDAVALKSKQDLFSDTTSTADLPNAQMPPPRKIRKTDSPSGIEDATSFIAGDLSTATN